MIRCYTPVHKNAVLVGVLLTACQSTFAAEISASEAAAHSGETTPVSGVHTAAASKGKPTFINFDKPYPNEDFVVVIWGDNRAAFGDLTKYAGHQVCAKGVISMYRGKPEMVLRDPGALLTN